MRQDNKVLVKGVWISQEKACPYCDLKFRTITALKDHIKKHFKPWRKNGE